MKKIKNSLFCYIRIIFLVLLFLILMGFRYVQAEEVFASHENVTTYSKNGSDACLSCHDTPSVTAILQTPHAQMADSRTMYATHGCEACHGASLQHGEMTGAEGWSPRPEITYGKHSPVPVSEQNKVCLGCHESGKGMNWRGSQHQFADVSCVSCHVVHTGQDKTLSRLTEPSVCYACHSTQRAQALMFSRHPINEGKVVCSDCHNVHGAFGPKLLIKETVNDSCYECHQEKRGPFLWEHAPAREDCSHCHMPHGTAQPRLLKLRTPWLCQQCHLAAFHPSTVYSGTGVPPQGGADRLLVQGCLNCHPQIHGSNHPSGIGLMR